MKRTRKPIGEMLSASNQGESKGIVCRDCGAVQVKGRRHVTNTVRVEGGVRRYMDCWNCGKPITTFERLGRE